jgi:HemY protein
MRKIFLLVLFALLLGVGVVALIETDPGYVLITYGNYTVETSLWVGLLVLGIFSLLVYWTLRLVRNIIGGQDSLVSWLGERRHQASSRMTTKGMINYIEGNWSRSRTQLLKGARNNEAPMINYLMAARASYSLDEPEKMREYLSAAEEAESGAGVAVELTQAEMKLDAGQYEQALATLVRARRNASRHPRVMDLLSKAYYGLKDWDSLAELIPELRKHKVLGESELRDLEREVHTHRLEQSVNAVGGTLLGSWQQMPGEMKRDPEIVAVYARLLIDQGEQAEAEKVIQRALKQQWDSRLVRLYGYVESDNPAKQLSRAEGWLSGHPNDPELLLCLGRLCARKELWGKARDYFERCYQANPSAEVCAELGRLLVALEEPKVAAAYFREGLMLREGELPELPLPEQQPTTPLLEGS